MGAEFRGGRVQLADMDVGLFFSARSTNGLVIMENHLNAAKGWLELGNHAEATRELEQIAPSLRVHPDVLEVRWSIYAKTRMWTAAFEIATAIAELAPERAFGWIHQAYSLHALGRTDKAYELLVKVADRFQDLIAFPYSLACYACQLGRPDEAFAWIERATKCGEAKRIMRAALEEPMLEPIWDRIRQSTGRKSVKWLPNTKAARGTRRVRRSKPLRAGVGRPTRRWN